MLDKKFKSFGEYIHAIKKASDSNGKNIDPRLKSRKSNRILFFTEEELYFMENLQKGLEFLK